MNPTPNRKGGPKTAKGKRISSRNALTHGLFSKTVVLPGEHRPTFRLLLDNLVEEHRPEGETQMTYVHTMACARWRCLRTLGLTKRAIMTAMDDLPSNQSPEVRATLAMQSLAESRFMDTMHRHEVAYDRQFTRALKSLQAAKDRKKAEKTNECVCIFRKTN